MEETDTKVAWHRKTGVSGRFGADLCCQRGGVDTSSQSSTMFVPETLLIAIDPIVPRRTQLTGANYTTPTGESDEMVSVTFRKIDSDSAGVYP